MGWLCKKVAISSPWPAWSAIEIFHFISIEQNFQLHLTFLNQDLTMSLKPEFAFSVLLPSGLAELLIWHKKDKMIRNGLDGFARHKPCKSYPNALCAKKTTSVDKESIRNVFYILQVCFWHWDPGNWAGASSELWHQRCPVSSRAVPAGAMPRGQGRACHLCPTLTVTHTWILWLA